jgi:hypothetical protein
MANGTHHPTLFPAPLDHCRPGWRAPGHGRCTVPAGRHAGGRTDGAALMSSSVGKRLRERQKQEKLQAKAERRAAREADQESAPDDGDGPARTEAELVADLQELQRAFEADEITIDEFDERREALTAEFGRLT